MCVATAPVVAEAERSEIPERKREREERERLRPIYF